MKKVARRVISCKDGIERKTEFSLERKGTNGIEGDEGERARADECSRVGDGRGEGGEERGGLQSAFTV